jgi:hypothetical protein
MTQIGDTDLGGLRVLVQAQEQTRMDRLDGYCSYIRAADPRRSHQLDRTGGWTRTGILTDPREWFSGLSVVLEVLDVDGDEERA